MSLAAPRRPRSRTRRRTGMRRIAWADRAHAGARLDPRRASPRRSRSPASAWPPACTSPARPPTWSARWWPAAPRCACAPPTRCRPRTTSRRRSWRSTASPCSPSRARTTPATTRHIRACLEFSPTLTMDDGADLVSSLLFVARGELDGVHPEVQAFAGALGDGGRDAADRRRARLHRGDDHRRDPPARDGARRRAALPGDRGQRLRHQAPVRQPLRHRSVHDGRHPARHQRPPRRAHASWWPATAGAGAASRCAPTASAPRSSSAR